MEFPVNVQVRVNQRKTELLNEKEGIWQVAVAAKPEQNEANLELIRYFSKIAGRHVRILKGLKSKKKVIG